MKSLRLIFLKLEHFENVKDVHEKRRKFSKPLGRQRDNQQQSTRLTFSVISALFLLKKTVYEGIIMLLSR